MMRDMRNGIDAEISKMSPKQILDYLKNTRREYNKAVVGL
jgi:hypothetical protein